MSEPQVEKGDQVSWKWGTSKPSGEVAEVSTNDAITIGTAKGNEVTRNAEPDDPAVHVAREGNDVVKRAHELTIDEKANGDFTAAAGQNGTKPSETNEKGTVENTATTDNAEDAKTNDKVEANDTAKAGEKHDLEDANEVESTESRDKGIEADSEKPAAKKQKTNGSDDKANGDEAPKKGRGRPKKSESAENVASKKKQPKPAATADGKPRRSARNAS